MHKLIPRCQHHFSSSSKRNNVVEGAGENASSRDADTIKNRWHVGKWFFFFNLKRSDSTFIIGKKKKKWVQHWMDSILVALLIEAVLPNSKERLFLARQWIFAWIHLKNHVVGAFTSLSHDWEMFSKILLLSSSHLLGGNSSIPEVVQFQVQALQASWRCLQVFGQNLLKLPGHCGHCDRIPHLDQHRLQIVEG